MSSTIESIALEAITDDENGFERFSTVSLQRLTDPAQVIKLVNKTMSLADDDFEDLIHSVGFRVALWYMRSFAIQGELKHVQALSKYLERCDQARLRSAPVVARSQPNASAFVQPERVNVDTAVDTDTISTNALVDKDNL